jgi:hypothetical protein
MRNVWLSLLAIAVCGGIGGVAGWAFAGLLGLGGVVAALAALVIATGIATALWAAGVALLDWWRRKARSR